MGEGRRRAEKEQGQWRWRNVNEAEGSREGKECKKETDE